MTGGTGFIGSNLIRELSKAGYKVRIYSRRSFYCGLFPEVKEEDWFAGELNDQSLILDACAGVDVVLHAAGIAHSNSTHLGELIDINANASDRIYAASVACGVKKFIYFSSILVSDSNETPYVISKRKAEELLLSRHESQSDTELVILRPANVYGPGMRGGLPSFIRLARGWYMPALPQLSSTFRMVSVSDLCKVALLAASPGTPYVDGQTVVVTDGETYSPNRIEAAVYAGLNLERPKWRIPRGFLLLAAMLAQALNAIGIRKNQLGISLYRNLIGKRQINGPDTSVSYKYRPTTNLESEMSRIIHSLEMD